MIKVQRHELFALVVGIGVSLLAAGQSVGYETIDVTDGGTIAGTVTLAGDAPALKQVEVTKDTSVCGKADIFDESIVVGESNGLRDVVVSIVGIEQGKAMGAPGVLDQKGCVYAPHVVLTPAGATMEILNDDGILHNIHTYSEKNPQINKAQPKFKKNMKQVFEVPEYIRVECDAHGWMNGWVVVQEHPYYAVTDASGMFSIDGVPAGEYQVKLWHPTLGEQVQNVSVKPNETATVDAELSQS